MFFKNKHIITSLIVAPILALISYFAVDYYVAEVPHKAKQGQAYKMLVKSNCRWESGVCDLINGELKINITSDSQTYGLNRLFVDASNNLRGIKFAVVEAQNKTSEPYSMTALNAAYTAWQSSQINVTKSDYLQFAISVNESVFYAEIPAIFIYKAPFP
ncbi:hypothetical protein BTHERMOSOX_1477 [Bathymodiolus thermophilus thioautotrophic gill symbiont]|uniref:Uncharacterized protein n=1 Tax=Bathymodiolus thermophilus thioautotrophic gill symbiont TaxID=2360 RepID=A0A3G3IMU9_9GAMM|nr:hypothetical protein [Bathymodiolus thermophilus thioautotrophic gill symbiont]AYQ57115.1 hypothetical protein MS2017_1427 [Bathymodiolus thermophilus thioautotrophic gill symbiont]CAB5499931.1 hypothetical protein THERMOS_1116 [Bathymodiolus thermophilus thioautotrophic gill symbiont]CAB5502268.1 hypothetical protein THERMOT_1583 [Bathymodiolus thermophilus thioautotrophic gill symbiont]SHA16828.1 hypothetical protein BTHERMOSOX_1477 [Bathymodiolus thermophilus thioautotrophic gill symbiont